MEDVDILEAVGVDTSEAACPRVFGAELGRDNMALSKDGLSKALHGLEQGFLGSARVEAVGNFVPRDVEAGFRAFVVHVEKELLIHAITCDETLELRNMSWRNGKILTVPRKEIARGILQLCACFHPPEASRHVEWRLLAVVIEVAGHLVLGRRLLGSGLSLGLLRLGLSWSLALVVCALARLALGGGGRESVRVLIDLGNEILVVV
ncbi:hypothetical protein PG993_008011 [Apiospora rasikravindrae]|uniref:Uncharacterized protein n=1 Tax=Apiospora rasikravindrae TaxID=990691 RepID=A0ABR1SZ49_9PEZI